MHFYTRLTSSLLQAAGTFFTRHQRDVSVDTLTSQFMWITNNRCFGNFRVQYQRGFDFRRTQTVARNVQHVVHTTGDPVVTIFATTCTVTLEVVARIHGGGAKETFVVAVRTHHGRPRSFDCQETFGWIAFDFTVFRPAVQAVQSKNGVVAEPGFQGR